MKSRQLLTIGYEGKSVDEFIEQLRKNKVTRLIDIREAPISHKKGLSKSALRELLNANDIEYIHLKTLGCPSTIRKQFKLDHDQDRLFKEYAKYLADNPKALAELDKYLSDGINCIMCFEADPNRCHRKVIVEKIKEYDGKGLKIEHI